MARITNEAYSSALESTYFEDFRESLDRQFDQVAQGLNEVALPELERELNQLGPVLDENSRLLATAGFLLAPEFSDPEKGIHAQVLGGLLNLYAKEPHLVQAALSRLAVGQALADGWAEQSISHARKWLFIGEEARTLVSKTA